MFSHLHIYCQSEDSMESKHKLIESFIGYTVWPNNTNSDKFIIGVSGNKEQTKAFTNYFANRSIKSKTVEVRLIENESQLEEVKILYVSLQSSLDLNSLVHLVKLKPILLIGEGNKATSLGFHIIFSSQQTNLSFEINPSSYNQSSLKIDYYLLRTSRIVNQN
jgi:hypothetical protein